MRSLRKTHISGQFSLIPSFLRLCVCVFTSNSILGAASVLHCLFDGGIPNAAVIRFKRNSIYD